MVTWNRDTQSNNNCWAETYSKQVKNIDVNKKYFERDMHGRFGASTQYDLTLNLRQKKMYVRVNFSMDTELFGKEEYVREAQTKFIQAIEQYWNNRFLLLIEDASTRCYNCKLDIIFQIIFIANNDDKHSDFMLAVKDPDPGFEREEVDRNIMAVYADSNLWTYAHEFGHAIGLPDEYSYDEKKNDIVTYKAPNNQTYKMDVPFYQPADNPKATIMSSDKNSKFEARHGWPLAIEAQELLRASRYKSAVCNIILLR